MKAKLINIDLEKNYKVLKLSRNGYINCFMKWNLHKRTNIMVMQTSWDGVITFTVM